MEALVIILAELLFGLTALAVSVAAGLVAAAVDLIGALLFRARRARREADGPAFSRRRSRWWHLLLLPLGLVVVASLLVGVVFPDAALRPAVKALAARSGYQVDYTGLNANLLTGRLHFTGMTVRRPAGRRTGYDLRIGDAELDLALWSLLFRPVRLEALHLASVTGTVVQGRKTGGRAADDSETKPLKPRRRFTIDRLQLGDVDLTVVARDGTRSRVAVTRALSQPLRSDLALFDFFFRSTVHMRIDGNPVDIVTAPQGADPTDTGQRTSWTIPAFPVATVAKLVRKAPFTWLDGGTLTATAAEDWTPGETSPKVDTLWHVTLSGVTVQVPRGAGLAEKLAATALAKVVNRRDKDTSFDFTLQLDRNDFRNTRSLATAGLWNALADAAAKGVAKRFGGDPDRIEGKINGALDKLKSLFRKD